MAAPDPIYSVVIPAYNEEHFLSDTLAHLQAAMAAIAMPGEVVVSDNHSTDRTAAIARAAGAQVVFEPERQIARARNRGAASARGRYLVFVDADTAISAPLLAAALTALDGGGAVGGGSTMAMSGGSGRLYALALGIWNPISRRLKLAAGGFIFARSDAFAAVGGFPTAYYAGEELWFSRALRRWGGERGLDFRILPGPSPRTSGRKAEWFPAPLLLASALLLLLCPWLLRSRRFCWIWYRRPRQKAGAVVPGSPRP